MSLLFLMPNWAAPSEVFFQRMLESLRDDLGCIATLYTEGEASWRGEVPAVSLTTPVWTFVERALLRVTGARRQMAEDEVLFRALKKYRISRVLCHFADFALRYDSVWSRTDIPLYVHFHGYDATFDLRRHQTPDTLYHPADYAERLIRLGRRATFIANSFFTRDLLVRAGLSPERIVVKHLGVPIPPQGRVHREKARATILHVGRLIDFKSPDRTIAAFDRACDAGMDAELVLAGDGPLRMTCELLRVRSPYRDRITILGAVDAETVAALMQEADIFTQHNVKGELSCQEECFGVSLIEAMAAGLPVVGTRSGAVPETMKEGETAFLVEPKDVEGQAEALLRLAGDASLRERLGAAGRRRVAESFSMAREAAALRRILKLGV